MATRTILYPERRVVSEEQLLGWAKDAFANGQIPSFETFEEACACLADAGLVTFAEEKPCDE